GGGAEEGGEAEQWGGGGGGRGEAAGRGGGEAGPPALRRRPAALRRVPGSQPRRQAIAARQHGDPGGALHRERDHRGVPAGRAKGAEGAADFPLVARVPGGFPETGWLRCVSLEPSVQGWFALDDLIRTEIPRTSCASDCRRSHRDTWAGRPVRIFLAPCDSGTAARCHTESRVQQYGNRRRLVCCWAGAHPRKWGHSLPRADQHAVAWR